MVIFSSLSKSLYFLELNKTIYDAMIAELKGAKFCIADFTKQKKGVYFESGFAFGQGKSVILL